MRVVAVIATVGLLMALMPAAVSAGRAITFDLWLGGWCVEGRANDSALVKITWKDSDQQLKALGSTRANPKGYWGYCGDGDERIEQGDIVTAAVGSRARTVTVPSLKLVIDRDDDVAQARYLPNSTVGLRACKRFNFNTARCTDLLQLTTNGDGRVTYDFSTFANLIGRDWVTATVAKGMDRFHRPAEVPFIKVFVGKARFWGYYKPFKRLSIELHRGTSQLDEWSGRADDWDWGFFAGRFADEGSDGDTYRVAPGDRIVIPAFGATADWTVPNVWAAVVRSSDVVRGSCGASNARYEIYARNVTGSRSGSRIGKTDSAGRFSTDMTVRFDIRRGDIVYVNCELPSGDLVSRRIVSR